MEELLSMLKEQHLFGLILISISGSLVFLLRNIPSYIYRLLLWRGTSSVTFYSEDANFYQISAWLAGIPYIKKARHLQYESYWNRETASLITNTSAGLGTHVFRWCKKWLIVHRTSSSTEAQQRRETIKIITLGSNARVLLNLLQEVKSIVTSPALLNVYTYDGQWVLRTLSKKRAWNTVILPTTQKERILNHFKHFLAQEDWYNTHGIPYKLGCLFHGIPGTGKTSLSLAIASHFNLPVYTLDFKSFEHESALISAFSSVPENAIVLLEDIDTYTPERRDSGSIVPTVSLSCILNLLDGIATKHGQIVIATTNHLDTLDPALRRPGRFDLTEEIKPLTRVEAQELCDLFKDTLDVSSVISEAYLPLPAAVLQGVILRKINRENTSKKI